jgi:hypothetical protein
MICHHHRDGLREVEGDDAFRGHSNIFVAGKRGARSASTGSQQATDQRTLAATGEATDQRASASAATNEAGGTFALAFGLAS